MREWRQWCVLLATSALPCASVLAEPLETDVFCGNGTTPSRLSITPDTEDHSRVRVTVDGRAAQNMAAQLNVVLNKKLPSRVTWAFPSNACVRGADNLSVACSAGSETVAVVFVVPGETSPGPIGQQYGQETGSAASREIQAVQVEMSLWESAMPTRSSGASDIVAIDQWMGRLIVGTGGGGPQQQNADAAANNSPSSAPPSEPAVPFESPQGTGEEETAAQTPPPTGTPSQESSPVSSANRTTNVLVPFGNCSLQ